MEDAGFLTGRNRPLLMGPKGSRGSGFSRFFKGKDLDIPIPGLLILGSGRGIAELPIFIFNLLWCSAYFIIQFWKRTSAFFAFQRWWSRDSLCADEDSLWLSHFTLNW